MELETRFITATLQAPPDKRTLTGYAAVFNSLSQPLRMRTPNGQVLEFRERINPGAFTETLAAKGEILALAHHAPSMVLGRRGAQTLRLEQDDKGLRVEVDLPNTTAGNDTLELVRRGDIRGMSFGFFPIDQAFSRDAAGVVRDLRKLDLREVTFTALPAYTATSVEVRSLPADLAAILAPAPDSDPLESHRRRLQMLQASA